MSDYEVKELNSIIVEGLKVTKYQYKLKENLEPFIKEREMDPPNINFNFMKLTKKGESEC